MKVLIKKPGFAYAKFIEQTRNLNFNFHTCDHCAYYTNDGKCASHNKECPFTLKDWLGWEHEEARHEA